MTDLFHRGTAVAAKTTSKCDGRPLDMEPIVSSGMVSVGRVDATSSNVRAAAWMFSARIFVADSSERDWDCFPQCLELS